MYLQALVTRVSYFFAIHQQGWKIQPSGFVQIAQFKSGFIVLNYILISEFYIPLSQIGFVLQSFMAIF